jgi:hypothetical protein
MKKIVLICGLIAGLITTGWTIISINTSVDSGKEFDMENGMLYGYASMILAFSLIFVAIKTYRDKHNGGMISFGKAFRIGLYISLIASSIYVLVWLIDYFYFLPEGFFEQHYTESILKEMKASGASQTELDAKVAEMAEFSKRYRNPFFNALMTYIEILPVGLLVSLIAALVLKRRNRKNEFQTAAA